MLQNPPSRINLTPSDINEFNRRFAQRQAARPNRFGTLRLSPGPNRGTGSFVSAKDNVGRKRADLCSSQAIIFHVDEEQDGLKSNDSDAALNPGAVVFVPRTRFGIAATSSMPVQAPNVDRYPPMRPVGIPRRKSSRQHLLAYERIPRPPFSVVSGREASSPAPSNSSRSTPNLLQASRSPPAGPRIHTRSSSLSWNRSHEDDHHVSSDAQPANATNSWYDFGDINRNSPLDELTASLSHLASGRPRSVGRSFQRTPNAGHTRISLLAGSPFDVSPERPMPDEEDRHEDLADPSQRIRRDSVNDTDPVSLALAMPPLHQPSTPIADSTRTSSPPSHSSGHRAVPSTRLPTATPRNMIVYDESKPAHLQPQTPADVSYTARRHGRSGTVLQRPAQAMHQNSPQPASSSNRHTYPAASSVVATPVPNREAEIIEAATGFTPVRVTPTAVREQIRRSARHDGVLRGLSYAQENDEEEVLHEMRADRAFRMQRLESGSLDITPPAERRYERFWE